MLLLLRWSTHRGGSIDSRPSGPQGHLRARELHTTHRVHDPRGSPIRQQGVVMLLVLRECPRCLGLLRPHVFLFLLILVEDKIQGSDVVASLV
jgi:hypothetical protein